MPISAAQCRAARGLLGWTQDELARNALVSRATVADFESNSRWPMRNNLVSIRDSLFAAGIEFLEGGNAGLGVRFRQQHIEFKKDVKFVDGDAWLQMRYVGEAFNCIISREAIEDFHGFSGSISDHKLSVAVSEILHHVVAIAERYAPRGIQNGKMIITTKMLTAETS